MALVPEDGTGLANATTFATIDELRAFARARNIELSGAQKDLEAMLTIALDSMVDSDLEYAGAPLKSTQALPHPRTGVRFDGYDRNWSMVRSILVNAQCALALESRNTDLLPTLTANAAGPIIERTVGPITTRFAESGRASRKPIVQKARAFLGKLLVGGGNTVRISRA